MLQYTTRKCKNTTQYNTAGINHDGRRPNSPQGCVTMPPGVQNLGSHSMLQIVPRKRNTFCELENLLFENPTSRALCASFPTLRTYNNVCMYLLRPRPSPSICYYFSPESIFRFWYGNLNAIFQTDPALYA